MMTTDVRMAHMTWQDFAEAMRRDPVVFLPVGSVEQHGPHLPLTVDTIIPEAISVAVAERVAGIVAPPFGYGYKSFPQSGGGQFFPGTLNLDASSLIGSVRNVLCELRRHGARKFAIAVGHWENQWMVTEAIDLASREFDDPNTTILRYEYWDFITSEIQAQILPPGHPGMEFEHAGIMETSLMLHLRPELVRLERLPDHPPAIRKPYDVWPPRADWIPQTGSLCSARTSTADKGRLMTDHLVDAISGVIRHELP